MICDFGALNRYQFNGGLPPLNHFVFVKRKHNLLSPNGTTVEPDKGGIHSDTAKLYKLDREMKLQCLFEAKKDLLPMKLFQYGYIRPVCHNGILYASVNGLQKYDGGTLVWENF